MSTLQNQYELALLESRQSQLRARFYAARITTGDYKEDKVKWGTGKALTEAELLRGDVDTMNRHIQRAEDHINRAKEILAQMEVQSCL